tara:strand:- start:146 stop:295 length:150 start_codon:yes stop_codon:yes gene_type:complete
MMPNSKQIRRAKSLHARIKRKVIKKVKTIRLENLYQKFRHFKRKKKKQP